MARECSARLEERYLVYCKLRIQRGSHRLRCEGSYRRSCLRPQRRASSVYKKNSPARRISIVCPSHFEAIEQVVTSYPVDQWMQALDNAQVDIDLSGTEFITFVVVSAALGFVFVRDMAGLLKSSYAYFIAVDRGSSEPITPRRKTLPPQERIKTTRLKLLEKERDKIERLCTEKKAEENLEDETSPDPNLLLSSPKISVRLALQAIAPGPRQRLIAQSYMALEKRILMLAERSRGERESQPSSDGDKFNDDFGPGNSIEDILRRAGSRAKRIRSEREISAAKWGELTQNLFTAAAEETAYNWLEGERRRDLSMNLETEAEALEVAESLKLLPTVDVEENGPVYSALLALLIENQLINPLITNCAAAALEDATVRIADGVAAEYLALETTASNLGIGEDESSMNGLEDYLPVLCDPALNSTRAIERVRNEISLARFIDQNFHSIVSIYEDRYTLWRLLPKSSQIQDDNESKKKIPREIRPQLAGANSRESILHKTGAWEKGPYLKQQQVRWSRRHELDALKGWRLLVSIALEAADVGFPIVRAFFIRLSGIASIVLAQLIGRGLGLIFRGVRESLRRDERDR